MNFFQLPAFLHTREGGGGRLFQNDKHAYYLRHSPSCHAVQSSYADAVYVHSNPPPCAVAPACRNVRYPLFKPILLFPLLSAAILLLTPRALLLHCPPVQSHAAFAAAVAAAADTPQQPRAAAEAPAEASSPVRAEQTPSFTTLGKGQQQQLRQQEKQEQQGDWRQEPVVQQNPSLQLEPQGVVRLQSCKRHKSSADPEETESQRSVNSNGVSTTERSPTRQSSSSYSSSGSSASAASAVNTPSRTPEETDEQFRENLKKELERLQQELEQRLLLCSDMDMQPEMCVQNPRCTYTAGEGSGLKQADLQAKEEARQQPQQGFCILNVEYMKQAAKDDCLLVSPGTAVAIARDMQREGLLPEQIAFSFVAHLRTRQDRTLLCRAITHAFFAAPATQLLFWEADMSVQDAHTAAPTSAKGGVGPAAQDTTPRQPLWKRPWQELLPWEKLLRILRRFP